MDASNKEPSETVVTFEEVVARNTGLETPLPAWLERQKSSSNLTAQTHLLADRLEAEGIPARSPRRDLVMVGLVTGCIEEVEGFRSIYILPLVAQRERQAMVGAFNLFREEHPKGKYFRYAVLTFGRRISLFGPLRETIAALQRRISKWSHEGLARYGVKILLRATEFAIDDVKSFHVHCNVIFVPDERMPPALWNEYLRWSHKFLRAHWRDNGRLEDPREVIKYVTKPADVTRLTNQEFAWLYAQTRRCKLVQPMGEFLAFRRALDHEKQKVVWVRTPKGGYLARMRRNSRAATHAKHTSEPLENLVVSRTLPVAKFTNRTEPCALISNFTTHPVTEGGRHRLRLIEEQCAEAEKLWNENEKRRLR